MKDMDERLRQINQRVKNYDNALFAMRAANGMIQIHRKPYRLELCDTFEHYSSEASIQSQFILALTDTWNLRGRPVDWGIEPVLEMIRSMDSHRDDSVFQEMKRKRELKEQDQKRAQKNELRARAADMRRDFARAVNDINTSTL